MGQTTDKGIFSVVLNITHLNLLHFEFVMFVGWKLHAVRSKRENGNKIVAVHVTTVITCESSPANRHIAGEMFFVK